MILALALAFPLLAAGGTGLGPVGTGPAAAPTALAAKALIELVVAPDGKPTNPGTQAAPLTLEAARDRLRTLARNRPGPLRVLLRGGLYPRTTSFDLDARDAGTASNPIEYVAWPGETPRLIGGSVLAPSSFQPVRPGDPNGARLALGAKAHILVADVSAYAADLGTLDSRVGGWDTTNQAAEVFADGTPMTLARYPDAVDPGSIVLARKGEAIRVSGQATPDVTGTYAYAGDDSLGRPFYRLRKGGEMWTIAAEANSAQWRLSNRRDLGGTGAPAIWGNWEGFNGPSGRFPAAGGQATGELLLEPADGSQALPGFLLIRNADPTTLSFDLTTPPGHAWAKPEEAMLFGSPYYTWSTGHIHPKGISPINGHVVLGTKPLYGIRNGQPLYIYNVLEELTVPGEYFLDRATARLYLRPSGDVAPREVLLSRLQVPVLRLTNAAWTTFQGLGFEVAKDTLVEAPTCDHVAFKACTFLNAGGWGLRLGGTQNLVDGCTLSGLGKGGIQAWGGNRFTLTPSGTRIQNCNIHHVSRLLWIAQPAISLGFAALGKQDDCVGITVSNNSLHDLPFEALYFLGNDHQIMLNDIHDTCQWTNDAGAIYTGRDWGSQGSVIRNNLFRHNFGPMGIRVAGVYLDDCASGVTVEDNIFYQCAPQYAIQHGGGRDDVLRYNLFVGQWQGIITDNRGMTAVNGVSGNSFNLLEKIQRYKYQAPPWSTRYPALAAIPDDWAKLQGSHWLQPEGVVIYGNLQYGPPGSTLLNQTHTGPAAKWFRQIDQNLEGVDPGFKDPTHGDFSLPANSPVWKLPGFSFFDVRQIGIQSH